MALPCTIPAAPAIEKLFEPFYNRRADIWNRLPVLIEFLYKKGWVIAMKVIIVGLGRMGKGLAMGFSRKGDHVTAIDLNPEVFKSLPKDFKGEKVVGVGFDREVLKKAKIDQVDALIACTATDEANIVVARIAKTIYRVPRVVARLYDVTKADTYRRIGIQTISTTTWGIERAMELLTYHHLDRVCEIGNGEMSLVCVDIPPLMAGHTVNELISVGEINVAGISRGNRTFIPTSGTRFEPGDVAYIIINNSAADKLKNMLGMIG